jgi:glycosyltransferase involved in cell wall biosynthesis
MDFMAAGKPIINAIEAGNDPVADAQCGLSILAENPKALADAIMHLSQMSPSDRLTLGEKGKKFVYEEHDYKVLAKKFINVMESK